MDFFGAPMTSTRKKRTRKSAGPPPPGGRYNDDVRKGLAHRDARAAYIRKLDSQLNKKTRTLAIKPTAGLSRYIAPIGEKEAGNTIEGRKRAGPRAFGVSNTVTDKSTLQSRTFHMRGHHFQLSLTRESGVLDPNSLGLLEDDFLLVLWENGKQVLGYRIMFIPHLKKLSLLSKRHDRNNEFTAYVRTLTPYSVMGEFLFDRGGNVPNLPTAIRKAVNCDLRKVRRLKPTDVQEWEKI